MVNQESSWIRMISKSLLISNNVLVKNLFFQTFCKNTLKFFKIIFEHCLQLKKLICSYFHRPPDIFHMPFLVETMFSKQINVGICLIIAFTIKVFESIRAQLTLLGFKSWQVNLKVGFAVLGKVAIILSLVRAATLNTF